jgi:hypothetical protein
MLCKLKCFVQSKKALAMTTLCQAIEEGGQVKLRHDQGLLV